MTNEILIINTGGTIGMKASASGYDNSQGHVAELLSKLPELLNDEMPGFEIIEHVPLLDSANVTPKIWGRIAEDVERYYNDFDGFVILHGTDTMAYSASALSFMLENLNKPVIFTGSQVPLEATRTDARDNLINALYIASKFELYEVGLCFHDVLLRGNRAKKLSSVSYHAFDSPNLPPLASIETKVKFKSHLLRKAPSVDFSIRRIKDVNIASIKLFPGMPSYYLEKLFDARLDALVLGTYGMGNAPVDDKQLMDIFSKAAEKGVILVNCTQCQHGSVNMQTYSVGSKLAEFGFISANDMTIEAVIGKLYYLLSCDLSCDEVRKQMQMNLRGELCEAKEGVKS